MTKYVYSASGQKLRVVHYTAMPNMNKEWGVKPKFSTAQILQQDSTDYLLGGSLVMQNGNVNKFLFEGGFALVRAASNKFAFYYYNQDHLGNIRQVTEADGTKKGCVIQKMNYYPFGAEFCDAVADSLVQPYKYNGKEFDNMHGLNTYDYGARQYNPVTGRWDRMDPLCEKDYKTSPYVYCGDNPISFIDPNGMKRKPTNETYKGQRVNVRYNYGQKRDHIHKGVDINFGAGAFDLGAPVYATHSGRATVKSCKNDRNGAGNRVWIDYKCSDGTKVSTGYFHLDTFTIQNGAWVNEGDQIGTIGNSAKGVEHYDTEKGHNTHNHYEVKVNGKNIDPGEEDKSDLIDTQELVRTHNSLPEVVVTPSPPQPEQPAPQQNDPQ